MEQKRSLRGEGKDKSTWERFCEDLQNAYSIMRSPICDNMGLAYQSGVREHRDAEIVFDKFRDEVIGEMDVIA